MFATPSSLLCPYTPWPLCLYTTQALCPPSPVCLYSSASMPPLQPSWPLCVYVTPALCPSGLSDSIQSSLYASQPPLCPNILVAQWISDSLSLCPVLSLCPRPRFLSVSLPRPWGLSGSMQLSLYTPFWPLCFHGAWALWLQGTLVSIRPSLYALQPFYPNISVALYVFVPLSLCPSHCLYGPRSLYAAGPLCSLPVACL